MLLPPSHLDLVLSYCDGVVSIRIDCASFHGALILDHLNQVMVILSNATFGVIWGHFSPCTVRKTV